MGARGVWAVLVSAGVVCAACGSTSQTSTAELPLSAYLVQGHEETGLHPTGRPATDRTAAQWSSGVPDSAAMTKRLPQEGFREAMQVSTGSTIGQGTSWVMELGSASAAAREQAAELKAYSSALGITRFNVPGIANAKGWDQATTDANILFTEGRCLMLVGDQLPSGSNDKPPVVAATRAILARTHGKSGACAT